MKRSKKRSKRVFLRFWRNDRGAVSVEYALLIVFIALIMVVGAVILGGGLRTVFTNVGNAVSAAPVGILPSTT